MAGAVTRTVTVVVAITLFSVGALAQGHGKAPLFFPPQNQYDYKTGQLNPDYYYFYEDNLYPFSYGGDVWTGTVTAIHGQEISLVWADKKGKIERFTGQVIPSYYVPFVDVVNGHYTSRKVSVAPPAPSLVGKTLIVYYIADSEKAEVEGKKTKVTTNWIFRFILQEGKH
jgi:hypothetical protein